MFRGSEADVLDRYYRAAKVVAADVILRVTSDSPLIDPTVCDSVLRLREATRRDLCLQQYSADMAAWEQAQSTFNSTGKGMAEMERNLESLTRSVRRFMSDQIAADGSGGWNDSIHEVLFPMLLACRNVSGNDLATNTGVQEIVTQAVGIGASGDSRSVTPMVTHSLALMPDQYKPVAVWYLDQFGWGLRRPHEAVIVLHSCRQCRAVHGGGSYPGRYGEAPL